MVIVLNYKDKLEFETAHFNSDKIAESILNGNIFTCDDVDYSQYSIFDVFPKLKKFYSLLSELPELNFPLAETMLKKNNKLTLQEVKQYANSIAYIFCYKTDMKKGICKSYFMAINENELIQLLNSLERKKI